MVVSDFEALIIIPKVHGVEEEWIEVVDLREKSVR